MSIASLDLLLDNTIFSGKDSCLTSQLRRRSVKQATPSQSFVPPTPGSPTGGITFKVSDHLKGPLPTQAPFTIGNIIIL